ncbi:MAG: hypothetical protein DWQ01_00240 [Planctomycetota bacterium]|nr:MAG: hypothetical protein DWQ01_00240 [Planctomycetota bacterium]
MEPIEWNPNFSVGVPSMDRQHLTIVTLINELIGSPDLEADTDALHLALDQLTRYSEDHFLAEEALLEGTGYPELLRQKEEHREFRRRIALLCHDTALGKPGGLNRLLTFLKDWWTHHILVEDMRYRPYFENQELSP